MAKIKEKDVIELDYTGRIKEDNTIFDTTDEKVAKDNNLFEKEAEYTPIVVCVGQGQIIKGLDKSLPGKETERPYTVVIPPEDAYGKKNARLIELVSTSKFLKQNIQPMPGLKVNIDGMMGLIKTVSGGRTLVDFNHPLAGKELVYDITINRIINDDKEKISSILKINPGIKGSEVDIKEGKTEIKTKEELPVQIKDELKKGIKELLPAIGEITVNTVKKDEPKPKKPESKQENLNIGNASPGLKGV